MPNKENLRVPTHEEAVANGKKAGKASVAARRAKKKMREDFEFYLSLIDEETGKCPQEVIAMQAIKKAMQGDIRAIAMIRDTIGEKPTENMNLTGEVGMMSDADRELLIEARRTYAARG
ncbi:MAG: hypothetical protein IIU73_07410 [Selenomonadales bacterium]|nr:hypothetical protein [Selenomonadales bacterium]